MLCRRYNIYTRRAGGAYSAVRFINDSCQMNRVGEHLKTSFKKIRLLPHYSRSAVGDIPAHRGYGGKGVGRNHGYRDKEYSSEAIHTHIETATANSARLWN